MLTASGEWTLALTVKTQNRSEGKWAGGQGTA